MFLGLAVFFVCLLAGKTQNVEAYEEYRDIFTNAFEGLNDEEVFTVTVESVEETVPTKKNEHTGIFKGYNLIYLTAEGFSPYAVSEELTPTLYKLIHSGFYFENYYVPLWSSSTSDGEYVNCTGLIPDQQFSFRRSAENREPFSLPAYFAAEGGKSYAYHNHTLSYYERYLTHPSVLHDGFRTYEL